MKPSSIYSGPEFVFKREPVTAPDSEDMETARICIENNSYGSTQQITHIASLPPMKSSELDKIEDKMLDIIEELAEVLDEGIKEMRAIASGESEKYYATQRKEAEKSK